MNVLLDTCAILFLSLEDPCVRLSTRKILDYPHVRAEW